MNEKDTILVINQNKQILRSLKEILTYEQYIVETAEDEHSGLITFQTLKNEVILLATAIFDNNGTDFIAKCLDINPAVKVIVIGANGTEYGASAMEKRVFDFVPTPVNLNQLLGSIRKGFTKLQTSDEASESSPVLKPKPIKKRKGTHTTHDGPNQESKTRPRNILLISENKAFRNTIDEVLSYEGYKVIVDQSPVEGLIKFSYHRDTLIMIDIPFSNQNEAGFLKDALKVNPHAVVIVVSEIERLTIAEDLMRQGAHGYLQKPPDLHRLLTTVKEGFDKLETQDEKSLLKNNEDYLGLTFNNGRIRGIRITADGEFSFLDANEDFHSIFFPTAVKSTQLKQAIEEFEYLINKTDVKESEIHHFFEKNPDFILSDDYKKAHSKIVLSSEDSNKLIPDFVLEPFEDKVLCDLLEIKLPQTRIYNFKKNRSRYSSAVIEACSQLRQYASFFDETINRAEIKNRYGLSLYKPSMVVIIGRTAKLDPIELKRIENDLPHLKLKTYDEVLNKMKRKNKL